MSFHDHAREATSPGVRAGHRELPACPGPGKKKPAFHLRTHAKWSPPKRALPRPQHESQPLRAGLKGTSADLTPQSPGRPRASPSVTWPRTPRVTHPHRPHRPLPPALAPPPPSSPSRGRCEHPEVQPCAPPPPWGAPRDTCPSRPTAPPLQGPRVAAAERTLGAAE